MVAFAWSGGGITAIICTLCAQHALDQNATLKMAFDNSDHTTVSGGTLGHALYGTAGRKMWFPEYDSLVKSPTAFELLSTRNSSQELPYWYGQVLDYIPYTLNLASLIALLRDLGYLPSILGKTNWWRLALNVLFEKGYGSSPYSAEFRGATTLINFGLLRKKKCPIARTADGAIKDDGAAVSLFPALYNSSTNASQILSTKLPNLKSEVGSMDAIAASSSFWNVALVEGSEVEYDLLKGWLNAYKAVGSAGSESVYSMDGGLIDTTGIVTLLREQHDSIVAFYNNNDDLTALNSTFSDLFGVASTTDTMNSLEGAALAQVFPSDLYAEFIANLTNPLLLRAQLTSVQVMNNSYLQVQPYTLKRLYVMSNQYAQDFLDTFNDTRVPSGLNEGWPNSMPVGMGTYNANMLCLFSQWKIRRFAEELI